MYHAAGGSYGVYASAVTNSTIANNTMDHTVDILSSSAGTVYRGNIGYNPVGTVSVSIPLTTVAITAQPYDRTFYITAGSSTCVFNGATIPSGGFGSVFVAAGTAPAPTYTSAPTWTVYGN
jgi:hypothetical protein